MTSSLQITQGDIDESIETDIDAWVEDRNEPRQTGLDFGDVEGLKTRQVKFGILDVRFTQVVSSATIPFIFKSARSL